MIVSSAFPPAEILASAVCFRDYDEHIKVVGVKDGKAIRIMNENGTGKVFIPSDYTFTCMQVHG